MQRPFKAGVEVQVVPAGQPEGYAGPGQALYSCIQETRQEGLVLHVPVGPEGPVQLQPGTEIVLWRYRGSATYVTTVTVLESWPGDPPLLFTTNPSNTQELLRRRYYRVPAKLPVRVGPAAGETRNISGSGVLVAVAPGLLRSGQPLHVEIGLPGPQGPVGVRGRVVRVVQGKDEDLAGICFEKIEEKKREVIIRYVFSRQRELMRLGELGYPWRRV